ncbi:MAG TPA: PAS domain S-box protein [Verrucomicrobiae bacterium]|nr:PAS domain S-box protein [Verrucomicrobiae bacterium]
MNFPAPIAVLVLADTESAAAQLREVLGNEAVEVVHGRLGVEPEKARAQLFALILVDIGRGALDELQVVEAIRSATRSRITPVVLLVPADLAPGFLEKAYGLGAVDILSKPLDFVALKAKVRGFVDLFRLTERADREAEQLRLIVQGTKDYAIFMLDPEGRVASWNAGARVLKGYDEADVLGRHLSLFYPPEVVATGWVEHELRVAADAGRFEDEGWRVRKDGSRFWANVVITALRDDDGSLRGYAKVTRDLTSRRQAEEAARQLAEEAASRRTAEAHAAKLAEQKERLRVTLASIGDAVISTDRLARIQFMNPIAEDLTGWTSAEASGMPLVEVFRIINETTRAPVDNPALRALEHGSIIGLANHTLLIARDGSERAIDDSAAPIRDADGNVVGSVLVFRDIGARRRAERQRNARSAATQALAVAESVAQGISGVLAAICEHMRWEAGLFWSPTPASDALVCTGAWSNGDPEIASLLEASSERPLSTGEGLPGRIRAACEPCWVIDFTQDASLPRAGAALAAGLHSAFGCPVHVGDRFLGVIEFFTRRLREPDPELLEMTATLAGGLGQFIERRQAEEALRQQTVIAEALLRVGRLLGEETDLHRLVQVVTDEATRLCGARFGAFFYNLVDEAGESFMLYTLSGVPRTAFEGFPMPRNTAVFGPTFRGEEMVRLDDVTQDPRYAKNAPYHGMPAGHLPVRSYLAASVVSRSGEVHGGLFFGHEDVGVFTEHHERLLRGVAGQAAIAIDNARLFQSAQNAAERLNLALGAAELGDWSWDAKTGVVTLSERAAAIFGVEPGPRMTWTDMQALLHPDDRERARSEVEHVIEHRLPYAIEYRVVQEGAGPAWVGALGRAVYDEAGRVTGMYGVVQDVSQRKRLEQSLSDSEARFRSLMEQAPFSIQVISPDGRTVRVNKSWEDLWGVTIDQLGDYNILEDEQLEKRGVMAQIRSAFEGTPALVPAIRYDPNETLPDRSRHSDPVRWVAAMAYPIKDDAGVVQEVVLVHDDVTARRRAEDALRESEERLRLALDAGQMGVWDWNVRTGVLQWSDSLEPLHGLAPGEFEGTMQHFQQLIHPDDRDGVRAAIDEALQRRGSFYTEFRNMRADGSVHWIAGSGKVFTDEAGAPARMIGIGLDVTARRRDEQTARFLSAASAALAEIVDFDSTLQKVAALAVPSFADWAAVDVIEANGDLRRVAVSHVDPARVRLAIEVQQKWPSPPDSPTGAWHIARTGEPELFPQITEQLLEASIRDTDALEAIRRLGLRSYIGVPLTLRGNVRGVMTFVMAESGHTYDETDLAVAQELAHRTAVAIENAELYEEMLQADRRKDEFLATLAHELRNPLAPIRSGLHVLSLAGPEKPVVAQARVMMERQVEHLVRLVDDLLDVSRITRNRIELRKEVVPLTEAIHSAAETSGPLIQRSGNALTIELPSYPINVIADRVRLAQVFSNLLNNAAKYTPSGGEIALSASVDGSEAVIRVRDSGLGIPSDSLDSIFEMFTQVHRDTAHAQGGLGIGLTLVKRLVELHGGSVEARSEGPGTGSEFIVRLPVLPDGQAVEPAVATSQSIPGASRRILVVDDNLDAASSLEMMLGLMGHEVRTSDDGPQAIAMARDFRPQLVLLDIGLPTMSGYDVCRAMRKETWADGAIVVALTGWGQEEDRRRSEEAGFDAHLVKPVDMDQLEQLVHQVRR